MRTSFVSLAPIPEHHRLPTIGWIASPVTSELDPVVLLRIDRFLGLGPLADLAVAVRVEHGRTPTLRRLGVVGFVERDRIGS